MRKYEMMYIIRPDLEQEAVEATTTRFQGIITEHGGEIQKHDVMGKRRLAYEIKKFRDGFYVLVNFTATKETIAELDRLIRISDNIIRHLIVQDVVA